jgi:site-specific DNA-methyltransferase (adenine-specific)
LNHPRTHHNAITNRYTQPGDLILDLTAGSGSTGVVALVTGRRFIGLELDYAYADTARRRL